MFKQVGNDTDKLINKFGLLNKSFANIKMDFQNGQGIRSLGNIVSKQDIANFEKFQKDLQNGISYHKAFNNNLANSHSYIQQQASSLRELITQRNLLNRQLRTGKITQEEYNTAITANQAQIQTLTNQTKSLTVAQRLATATSKALSIGLNLIGNIAIASVVNLIITGITKLVNKEKELCDTAKESADEIKSQADEMKKLASEYETILDSEKTDAEKTVELNKWKQTLVETYKIERDELRKLNTDREYGIQLLEDEIDAVNSRNRNKWLGENKEAVDTAISKINSTQIGAFTIDDNSIYDNIKQYVKGSMGGTYSVIGDNLIEQYDNLERIIEYFGSKSELSTTENDLLKKLNKEKDKAKKILDEYKDNYETYYQYTAQNLLSNYAVDDKAIENVSQETYEAWKDGLISTANGDEETEKALLSILEEQFPDYETYFNNYYKNLAEAQKKFVNSIHVNNQDDAVLAQQISEYIGNLDEQELSILLTFDDNVFNEGIGIVKRKIAKFKEENPIDVDFKISDYQEQIESVSGNIKTLQVSLDKLDNNEFDFTNDIYDLAKAFPEYSTEILNASGDTEQLRKVLQELLNSQPNDLINSLTELKGSLASDEDIKAVDNLINILRNSASVAYSVTSLSDSLQDLNDKESILSTVCK